MKLNSIRKIHTSGYKIYVTATGGGTSFLGNFLTVPGGSSVIVGGCIPYAKEATDELLGESLEKYADGLAARKLAEYSYEKVFKLTNSGFSVGIGVACALSKENERVGRQKLISICFKKALSSRLIEISYTKTLPREQEENAVNNIILDSLMSFLFSQEQHNIDFGVLSNIDYTVKNSSARRHYNPDLPTDKIAIYPGSFNPIHNGHREIIAKAEKILKQDIYFEISKTNFEKPSIDDFEINRRMECFTDHEKNFTIVSKAPLFVDKVTYLRNLSPELKITFIVGADTWNRIYNHRTNGTLDIEFFKKHGVKFLVFNRPDVTFIENKDSELIIQSEEAFNYHNPISSSSIRGIKESIK